MKDPAAFLLLLALSAEDIALRSHQDSSVADAYRAKGLSIINNRIKDRHHSITDGAISACAVLAGSDVGYAHSYTI